MKKEASLRREEEGRGLVDHLLSLLRSIKLTIFLLILLAILSIVGTLITQNATPQEYVARYGVSLYEVLNFFNLFDMYHSGWFTAILLLLVLNLIACSLERIPTILKQVLRSSDRKGIETSELKNLPFVERLGRLPFSENMVEEIRRYVRKSFGPCEKVETQAAITLYCEKGRFSRLGVPLTHLSVVIILFGAILGSWYGFKGFVNILEGEATDHIYLRVRDREIPRPLGFSVRCDDFQLIFYDLPGKTEKHVKEYVSHLTILEDGREVLKQAIKVNHPLHYKGLAFYQSSYGALYDATVAILWRDNKREKVTLKLSEGETTPIPGSNLFLRLLRYAPQVHNLGEGIQVALLGPSQTPQAFWLVRGAPLFEPPGGGTIALRLEGIETREYTGLQVAKDPGVWIVWFGCGLMILGLFWAFFFSHQRLWVRIPLDSSKEEIILAGSTNKNRLGFERTFTKLADEIRSRLGR